MSYITAPLMGARIISSVLNNSQMARGGHISKASHLIKAGQQTQMLHIESRIGEGNTSVGQLPCAHLNRQNGSLQFGVIGLKNILEQEDFNTRRI